MKTANGKFLQMVVLCTLIVLTSCNKEGIQSSGSASEKPTVANDTATTQTAAQSADVVTIQTATQSAETTQTAKSEGTEGDGIKADYLAKVNANTDFAGVFKLDEMTFKTAKNVIVFNAQLECLADYDQKHAMITTFVKDNKIVGGFQDIVLADQDGKPYKKGDKIKINRVVQLAQPFDRENAPAMNLFIANEKQRLKVNNTDLLMGGEFGSVVWEFPG